MMPRSCWFCHKRHTRQLDHCSAECEEAWAAVWCLRPKPKAYDGLVAYANIYNRVLTDTEITAIYRAPGGDKLP